jgi:hypothetical protein
MAGTTGVVARKCVIPEGNSILLPIINYGATLADEPTIKSEFELHMLAKREIDIVSDLEVNIDGVKVDKLQKYRVASPTFDVILPEDNLFNGIPGRTRGAADGYWLFLQPLSKGEHNIFSFGSCLAGRVKISLTIEMKIVDGCL